MSKHKNDSKSQGENTTSSMNPEGAAVPSDAAKDIPLNGAGSDSAAIGSSSDSLVPEIGTAAIREAASPSDSQATELELARDEIAALRSQVNELNEKYLRKLADEVNFRKRMLREKEETQKYAVASLLGDLIPVLDDFDRGIASVGNSNSCEQLSEGVILIRKQLSQMLENKYALRRFESKGTAFDPNRHEALFAEPADVEEPVVAEEYLPGYALHDRILRTAKVKVKIPGPQKPEKAPEASNDGDTAKNTDPADAAGQV